MGKKQSTKGMGLVIVIAGTIWLFIEHPMVAWCGVIVILLLVVLMAVGTGSGECQVCGSKLKRKKYICTIKGAQKTICPACNQRLAKMKSKEAIDALVK
jgi:hypothetical protein